MDPILRCHDIVSLNFVRGDNCLLIDDRGDSYVDFESGIWSTALGHCHPTITRVIQDQAQQIIHLGTRYPSNGSRKAARSLARVAGLDGGKCTFLSSGSEAVEFATQLVRTITGKPRLLVFQNAYLAAYGSAGHKTGTDWWPIDWTRLREQDIEQTLDRLPFNEIGGFVLEPGGSGSGFVRFPPVDLVKRLSRLIRENGGIVVSNEVTTGVGRTGRWFGFQHYGIQPDVVAVGKGIGNGYPVSAVVMERSVADRLEASGFRYAQSHQNDPLGCAVVDAVITTIETEGLIDRGRQLGSDFLDMLTSLAKLPSVKQTRGRGMLLGLELHEDPNRPVERVFHQLLGHRFLTGVYPAGNLLRFDPALTMEPHHMTSLVQCLAELLR